LKLLHFKKFNSIVIFYFLDISPCSYFCPPLLIWQWEKSLSCFQHTCNCLCIWISGYQPPWKVAMRTLQRTIQHVKLQNINTFL